MPTQALDGTRRGAQAFPLLANDVANNLVDPHGQRLGNFAHLR